MNQYLTTFHVLLELAEKTPADIGAVRGNLYNLAQQEERKCFHQVLHEVICCAVTTVQDTLLGEGTPRETFLHRLNKVTKQMLLRPFTPEKKLLESQPIGGVGIFLAFHRASLVALVTIWLLATAWPAAE